MKQLQAILHTKAALVSMIVLILVLLLSQFDLIANFNKESNLSDNTIQEEYDQDSDQNINPQIDKDELLDNNESNNHDEPEIGDNSQTLNLLKPTATSDVSVDDSSDSSSTTIPSSPTPTPSIFDTSTLKNIAAISIFNIEVIDNYGNFSEATLFSTSENRSYYFDKTDIETEILKCIGSSGIVIESIDYNESLNKLVVTLSKSEQTTTVVLENQGIVLRNCVTLDLNETFLQTFEGYPDTSDYGQEMPKYGTNETYLTPIEGYTATPPSIVPFVSYTRDRYSSGNYTFLGWYTQPTGGELFDFTSSKITEPFTLYAQWAKNVITDGEGSVYDVNSSKFQNTTISAYTASSNNIDQNTTDASLLWTVAGISNPLTIEVLNTNQEILYTSEKVPVAATINWSITNTETINNQTTFTLSGFIGLPDGYTWSSSSTIDERITGKITIDLTPVKVSSLYHDQLIYDYSYQAGLAFLTLDSFPTEKTYFNSTNDSAQINSMQSNIFGSSDKYPKLILENGDIIDSVLNASNCTLTAIFYPSDGSNKAYITFTVIADTLPDGYEWTDNYNNSISITFYIENPLTVSEIKLPYIGMDYDGSPLNETIITLNEYYTISLSDTYNDSSNNLIINNNMFIYEEDLVTDFFTVLTRWHMGDQNDENGVSNFYNMYKAFPGVASDGSPIYTPLSGVPVLCTIDTSDVDNETRIGLYVATCELNKNVSLSGYDLINSNPNTITIKLDVTPATNSILNYEPLANDITDDIENVSSDVNISTE